MNKRRLCGITVCVLVAVVVSGCPGPTETRVRIVRTPAPNITPAGYAITLRSVRAWVEDIEREGMPASSLVKLGDNQSVLGMTISADGNTLVFSLGEVVRGEDGRQTAVANLRSVRTEGGGMTELTSGQWLDTDAVLSPDGHVYFSSDRLRKFGRDIFRISSTRTSAIAVIRQTPEGLNYEPSVGDNGMLAYTYRPIYSAQLSSPPHIWTMGGQNQYPTQLREGSMPALSPDGEKIAYIGNDRQLWKIPVLGQNPVQLTNTNSPDGKRDPTWSPDGNYILYASDEAKDSQDVANYDIWMIEANGVNPRQLTTNGSRDILPLVSPDQRYIYFVSNRGFKEGIWRIPFPASSELSVPGDGIKDSTDIMP